MSSTHSANFAVGDDGDSAVCEAGVYTIVNVMDQECTGIIGVVLRGNRDGVALGYCQ